mmetsp:Transcript_22398/g.46575  ORF Transcript_22398/g.46575 Transcript_22398/m.46575 type:complete len:103 (+) Transcript_22398:220-528(+)
MSSLHTLESSEETTQGPINRLHTRDDSIRKLQTILYSRETQVNFLECKNAQLEAEVDSLRETIAKLEKMAEEQQGMLKIGMEKMMAQQELIENFTNNCDGLN